MFDTEYLEQMLRALFVLAAIGVFSLLCASITGIYFLIEWLYL